jgi:hypothetical protein
MNSIKIWFFAIISVILSFISGALFQIIAGFLGNKNFALMNHLTLTDIVVFLLSLLLSIAVPYFLIKKRYGKYAATHFGRRTVLILIAVWIISMLFF